MALAITASFVESCQLDISWPSTADTQRYSIVVSGGCDKQERITEAAAAGLQDGSGLCRVQLNLTEMGSNSSSCSVSVKGTSSSRTEVKGILASRVVRSGSQSTAVSATDVVGTAIASATANSGGSDYILNLKTQLSLSTALAGKVMRSFVSVCLFPFCLLYQLTFHVDVLHVHGIESQNHMSVSGLGKDSSSVGLTLINGGLFSSLVLYLHVTVVKTSISCR